MVPLPQTERNSERNGQRKIRAQLPHLRERWPWTNRTSTGEDPKSTRDDDQPQLKLKVAIMAFCCSLGLLVFHAILTNMAIRRITCQSRLSISFIGAVILPWANSGELATSVVVAYVGKISLSTDDTVRSTMHTTMLTLPICVLLRTALQKEATLVFSSALYVVFGLVAALMLLLLERDRHSQWLLGVPAVVLWLNLSLCAWYDRNPYEPIDCLQRSQH